MAAQKIELGYPGRTLWEQFMEPVGLSAYALAKAIGAPLPWLSDIVWEKRIIASELAMLLWAHWVPPAATGSIFTRIKVCRRRKIGL